MLEVTDGVSPAWWDLEVYAGNVLVSARWMAVLGDRFAHPAYTFLWRVDGRPALLTFGVVVDVTGPYGPIDVARIAGSSEAAPPPLLVLVQPGYELAWLGPAAADRGSGERFLAAIERWATDHGVQTVAAPYVGDASPAVAVFERAGFARLPSADRAVLRLPDDSYPTYLARLPGRRRREVERETRRADLRVVTTPIADCVDLLATLRCAQLDRYGGGTSVDRERVRVLRAAATFGEDGVAFVARHGADVVRVSSFVRFGDEWYAFYTGAQYGHPAARHSYFIAMFYEPVRYGIAAGIRRIHYGIPCDGMKRARGCVGDPLWLWLKRVGPSAPPGPAHRGG